MSRSDDESASHEYVKYPTSKTAGDAVLEISKGLVSAIPLVGGPVEKVLALIETPYNKRVRTFLNDLSKGLTELESTFKEFQCKLLEDNELFMPTVVHATRIATTAIRREKIEALRNACLNTALKGTADSTVHELFLTFIDELTDLHMRILAFAWSKAGSYEKNSATDEYYEDGPFLVYSGLTDFMRLMQQSWLPNFPEDEGRALIANVVRDLQRRGLLDALDPINFTFRFPLVSSQSLGRKFIDFISSPI